jgi:hypothetical protein
MGKGGVLGPVVVEAPNYSPSPAPRSPSAEGVREAERSRGAALRRVETPLFMSPDSKRRSVVRDPRQHVDFIRRFCRGGQAICRGISQRGCGGQR